MRAAWTTPASCPVTCWRSAPKRKMPADSRRSSASDVRRSTPVTGIRRKLSGFTLTELVIVIVIAAILTAFAVSRIGTQGFDTEGFANQAIAMVRYAHKVPISQRRTVAVVVTAGTPGTLRLCYTNPSCAGGDLHEPPGENAFTKTSKSNVTVAGASFTFDALGKPSAGGAITVSGDGSHTITI